MEPFFQQICMQHNQLVVMVHMVHILKHIVWHKSELVFFSVGEAIFLEFVTKPCAGCMLSFFIFCFVFFAQMFSDPNFCCNSDHFSSYLLNVFRKVAVLLFLCFVKS